MALRFRLRGLAETFVDEVSCPCCGVVGADDQFFSTELTRVTYDGIVIIIQCKACQEIFVPQNQRLGVVNSLALRSAVEKDSTDSGETILPSVSAVKLLSERLNASRKGEVA